ncbi:MAG: hypothetical protein U0183_08660 [Polyangiaceae bacterium]
MVPKILVYTLIGAFIGGVRGWMWQRERLERQRRAPSAPRERAPSPLVSMGSLPLSGPAWGWVWFHSAATGARGLGYYYADSTHGPCLRVFVDLHDEPDESALRAAIAARLTSGGVLQPVTAFRLVSGDAPAEAAEARALFESGRDDEGGYGTILLRVSAFERERLAIPERPAFVDSLF